METSKDRVLKAINHIQPDTTPVHILGFEGIERWQEFLGVDEDFDLRDKLGLDVQMARTIYHGSNVERGLTIWGTEPTAFGYEGAGYSGGRNYPLAGATSLADIDGFTWPDPDDFDYGIFGEVLRTVPEKARFVRPTYAVKLNGLTREEAARGSGAWLPVICILFELFGLEDTLCRLHTD